MVSTLVAPPGDAVNRNGPWSVFRTTKQYRRTRKSFGSHAPATVGETTTWDERRVRYMRKEDRGLVRWMVRLRRKRDLRGISALQRAGDVCRSFPDKR